MVKWALVSMDQQWLNKPENLDRCAHFTATAGKSGCSLVIFPEMTLTGFSLETDVTLESLDGSQTLESFRELAQINQIEVIFGACLSDNQKTKPLNGFCVSRPDGSVDVIYEKTHPFSFAGEDNVYGAGDHLGLTEAGGAKIGAAICYDLRFPELYSMMALQCQAIITIANWPKSRASHWRTLLQARAVENQCYSVGVNRTGSDGNGLDYKKSSMVVSPDGEIMMPVEAIGDQLDIYEIDLDFVNNYRELFPTVKDKRFSLYRELQGNRNVEQ